MEQKRLTRSRTDRMVAGICGGFAEYFQLDASLVRIGVILICLVTAIFPVCVIYGVMWFVIPEKTV
jgi:phage shock protein C